MTTRSRSDPVRRTLCGYGGLVHAVLYEREPGRWRYRYLPRRKLGRHLAIRVVCERYLQARRVWEETHAWLDWYRQSDEGELLYRGHRYVLVRSLDPLRQSMCPTTRWPDEIVAQRRRDTAFMDAMHQIRWTDRFGRPIEHRVRLLRTEPHGV